MRGGLLAATDMILSGDVPTAFLTGNDVIALGIIECLSKHGFRIPGDISVVGFDDIEYASLPGIKLTTVHEPRYEVGRQAGTLLLRLFDGEEGPFREILRGEMRLRNTSAKAKNM